MKKIKMLDDIPRDTLIKLSRAVGVGLMGTAFLKSSLTNESETYAQVTAIIGGAIYIGSYISECAYYLKSYLDKKPYAQENPSELEDKLKE
ncbi:MAG: hypothetical protein ISS82_03465 [Nanoarchaeota archaeon]|nr:hypothetical protein [Nanoarchaeota archaeon]